MADLLVHGGSITELFRELSLRLKTVVPYQFVNLSTYDPLQQTVRLNLWEGEPVPQLPRKLPASETVTGWVCLHQQPLSLSDIEAETRFPHIAALLRERHLRSYFALPLTSGEHAIGALGFGSAEVSAYDQADLDLLQRVAKLVALAVENSQTRHALTAEKERLKALLQVNQQLLTYSSLHDLMTRISTSTGGLLAHDYLAILVDDESEPGSFHLYQGTPEVAGNSGGDDAAPLSDPHRAEYRKTSRECRFTDAELAAMSSPVIKGIVEQGIRSLACVPLSSGASDLGVLLVGSREEKVLDDGEMEVLPQLAAQMAIAIAHARTWQQVQKLKDKLAEEKLYLEDEIRTELNFEQIIGESDNLKRTLAAARTVASSEATVLILGETGTGKELIARAIHDMSSRHGKNFIKVNCAAIPTGLLESELFGHERGAFTGALMQKIGRLELADGGTLFLDEVGDIPLELQPKLLRVLQEQEFERLGSNRTLKVNVRIIAATNRDMKRSIENREFRRDLYYRLNVFPLHLPPLRERRKDIPLLVRYFVQRFARRMNKPIETIPSETMNILVNWDWPGNVRELENFLERSVILSKARTLTVPVSELQAVSESSSKKDLTLMAAEREHILKILRDSGGVISGVRGAAARLGVKRTTLQSKMQKLGIRRQDYEN